MCGHAREDEYHWNLLPTEWMKDCAKSESTSYPYCSNRTGSRGSSSSVIAPALCPNSATMAGLGCLPIIPTGI